MKVTVVLTTALALASGIDVATAATFSSKQVKQLTGKNFKRLVQGSPVSLDWAAFTSCGYCKKLAPEYDRAAENLKGLVNLVAVDCDAEENKPFCAAEGVQGFPTLKVYPGGSAPPSSYDGAREAKPMVDYLTARMPTFVKRATSLQEVEALKAKAQDKPISLLFTAAASVTPMYKALSADFHKTLDFYAAREAKVGKEAMALFGVDKVPALLVLDGDKVTKYDGAFSAGHCQIPLRVDSQYVWLANGTPGAGPLKYDALNAWLKPFATKKGKKGKKDEL
ncbi:BZ3500_MvSof-1268-A1-R1_Chr3-1g06017 [Microbotryum saponariae]|uniref:BZ3500_MvSof-1268-A1-R1_Chr3-1g06017 protein n=1 Tax=Microbotryum saponariae TaxID=289078 RepID=A0A2X0KZ18_9BASI|nr:BZ3500_MvSof-1268-A1-R1_Chr3-1g06017 [Microbotryum saponariae]SDA05207.1 BZ3501_MvSof-1269-A2-R1_Chr3-1g05687 [Microbotryum saponariae]